MTPGELTYRGKPLMQLTIDELRKAVCQLYQLYLDRGKTIEDISRLYGDRK